MIENCCPECVLQNLIAAARSWIGTPFHARAAVKNVGVDCVHLMLEIYKEAGILPPDSSLPTLYPMDGGSHLNRSLVVDFLKSDSNFYQVQKGKFQPGDLLLMNMGRVIHHTAFLEFKNRIIHAMDPAGVIYGDLKDPTISKRVEQVWRPVLFKSSGFSGRVEMLPRLKKCCK